MAITEDTPEGGPEELQWKIDRLLEQLERNKAELDRERASHRETEKRYFALQDRHDTLTGRLTVSVLRDAGYIVEIEDLGEEYQ